MISSCQKIILEQFIVCIEDNDLSILGEGTETEREAAWKAILAQYATITADSSYSSMWKMKRDLEVLKAKIIVIQFCVDRMSEYYLDSFGQILSNYGLNYNWDVEREQYLTQLEQVVTKSKTWVIQRDLLQKKWDDLTKEAGAGKVTREYFEDLLLMFSKDAGYHLRTTELTVFQFARLIVAFRKKSKVKTKR